METLRQKISRFLYPVIQRVGKSTKMGSVISNENKVYPISSFYDLEVQLIDQKSILLSSFKGKNIMIVNTASDCGYTAQYEELQELYDSMHDTLVIIGFPSNDFGEQEKEENEKIESFCKLNYGVTFMLAKKSSVLKGENQNSIYKWLTDATLNGWNTQEPIWNFSKYVINEEGVLTHFFGPSISPKSKLIKNSINK
ncbi:MAG: glutathione peroxidase [Bacteroidia bacterium]|nr:glutathione peroxidase [Bacteroidia bacterium]